jgi:hypothetical protein
MTERTDGRNRPSKPGRTGIGTSGNEYDLSLENGARDLAELAGVSRPISTSVALDGGSA